MNALKQWFQSLTTGQKIFIVVCVLVNITIIIGFAFLGVLWNRPIVVIPIVIIAVCLVSDIKRFIDAFNRY